MRTTRPRKPACPYRKERWHNDVKRTPWTEEAKALVTKAIDIGILRFDIVSEEVGEEREEVHKHMPTLKEMQPALGEAGHTHQTKRDPLCTK